MFSTTVWLFDGPNSTVCYCCTVIVVMGFLFKQYELFTISPRDGSDSPTLRFLSASDRWRKAWFVGEVTALLSLAQEYNATPVF
jgi:hypothetical protein